MSWLGFIAEYEWMTFTKNARQSVRHAGEAVGNNGCYLSKGLGICTSIREQLARLLGMKEKG